MNIPQTTLTKKIFVALTGLFLAFFLIIHLAGNLQLLLPEQVAHTQFNSYSHLLSGNPVIKLVSYVLYIAIFYHAFDALMLTISNWKANDGNYDKDARGEVSSWISRNMGILGSVIFLFLVIHFKDYWYIYKFGETAVDAKGNKDLYIIVIESFKQLWYVLFYVIAMVILGLHLWHGIRSAFTTLGLYHEKYIKLVKYISCFFTFIVSLGFAIIPIIIYLKNM